MFHLLLVLPVIFILVFIISVIITSIITIIASAVGGASVALWVKNKIARRLLFIALSIVAFGGVIVLVPFIVLYLKLSADLILPTIIMILICIAILSFLGIKISNTINTELGKRIIKILFSVMLFIAITLAIAIPILNMILI